MAVEPIDHDLQGSGEFAKQRGDQTGRNANAGRQQDEADLADPKHAPQERDRIRKAKTGCR
ncbi:hypothetical protein [Novosphingobium fuchskuhlense]|uniref:hypothetical protein n=1 Tax=Novosphingobium fuchskuhlense TaxID=1117702 RepID=UPI001F0B0E77|nr:hypothetical protein [Novosphingobium fuchskuhlense]